MSEWKRRPEKERKPELVDKVAFVRALFSAYVWRETKFESQTHFLLLQKKTSGEQVLQPAVVVRETRCKSIGNCALYR